MAAARRLLLLSLVPLLLVSGDAPATSRPNHQAHQHHGSSHHHRVREHNNPGPVSWSTRHNAHAAQYPHSRHHNHDSLLRRSSDSRVLGYRSLSHSTTSTTPSTTTTTTSRNHVRSSGYGRPRDERLSALIEPSASRTVAYSTIVDQQMQQQHHHQRENLLPIYPSINVPTLPPMVYSKFQPGRRVCSRTSEASSATVATTHHHRSRQARLAYNADLPSTSSGFLCCPGWTQVTRLSFGCNKPVCSLSCQNGGVCSSPGRCTCPKGFTGNYCQIDVDECVTEKPCDQICRNVPGTYECYCRTGYELQPDRHSCRKNDSDGTALEARDLELDYEETTTTTTRRPILRDTENEVGDSDEDEEESSYQELFRRLIKLEKQFAKGKKRETETNEITTRIAAAIDSINDIRRSVQNMQVMQQEIYELRNKLKLYEFEARKIQHLSNRVIELENRLRLRCRSGVYSSF